jgi:hypothetical protein
MADTTVAYLNSGGDGSGLTLPYYADINPPPEGVGVPSGTVVATVAQVQNSSSSGAYLTDNNVWVVPVLQPKAGVTQSSSSTATDPVQVQMETVTIIGKRIKPAKINAPFSNPLNNYASYTYGWSLWWLGVDDFNAINNATADNLSVQQWNPTPGVSYVIAEDGGQFPMQRLPTTAGLNYYIDSVAFDTVLVPGKTNLSTNLIQGTMVVKEPYGVTLIDSIVMWSQRGEGSGANYIDQPYMLQLDFFGYDDNGKLMDSSALNIKKRFPVRIINIKLEITGGGGAQYTISFVPLGHGVAYYEENSNVPKLMYLRGKTVGDVLSDFSYQLNQFYQDAAYKKNLSSLSNGYLFDIHPEIRSSTVTYPSDTTIAKSASLTGLDFKNGQFVIPEGSKINAIVDKIITISSFITDQIAEHGCNNPNSTHTKEFYTFKTTVKLQYGYIDIQGIPQINKNSHDRQKNSYAKIMTYNISPYTTFRGNNPNIDTAPDSTPYTIKAYNYIYTGKNVDVIDLKLNFDTTYYNRFLGYTDTYGAEQPTRDRVVDAVQGELGIPIPYGTNALNTVYPNLMSQVVSPSYMRYSAIVNDKNITGSMNILNSPLTQKAADVVSSLTSSSMGDMITVDLTIIGDPQLIKQDDWFVSPGPSNTAYTNASQQDILSKYGFCRTDSGELIVSLTINSPIDQDADLSNQGLMYWAGGSSNPGISLFSGQYYIIKIKNNFNSGKFQQVLQLARYINGNQAQAIAENDAVRTSVKNQTPSVSTNGSAAVAGDQPTVPQQVIQGPKWTGPKSR